MISYTLNSQTQITSDPNYWSSHLASLNAEEPGDPAVTVKCLTLVWTLFEEMYLPVKKSQGDART